MSNVTRLKPRALTGAERQARYKERQKLKKLALIQDTTPSPVTTLTQVTPSAVPPQPHVETLTYVPDKPTTGLLLRGTTFTAALSLATVSAGFSIVGLTHIFVGAEVPVIAMGVALELGKLSAVAWVGRHADGKLKYPLIMLVIVLMGLNSVGAYGFLSKAQISHSVAGTVAHTGQLADIDGRLAVQQNSLDGIDRQIDEIHSRITKATSMGRVSVAGDITANERQNLKLLQSQRMTAAKTVAELQVEKARINGEHASFNADLGPVRYLSVLMGVDSETTLRWFILLVAMLLDPAAVLLLLAATRCPDGEGR